MSSSVFQDVRNWTSSTVVVLDMRQHLRPFWVFPADVRLMVILRCNSAYLQRINSFPEPCAAVCNNFAWNHWPVLPGSFLLKESSAPCFPPCFCRQQWLRCTLAVVSPQIVWTFLSIAPTLHIVCTREGWVPPTPQVHGLGNLGRSELPRVSFFHKNAVNLNKLGQHHLMAMPSQPRPRCDRAGLSVCTLAACPS